MPKEIDFSSLFKSWLTRYQLSRDEAASLLGVERETIDGWCVGRREPFEHMIRLAMSFVVAFPEEARRIAEDHARAAPEQDRN